MRERLLLVAILMAALQCAAQIAVRQFKTEDGLPSNNVYEVFSDHNGFLWAATDNGIGRFDGKKFKVLTSADGIPDNEVFGFFQDSHHRLWLRTYSGRTCYLRGDQIYTAANDPSLATLEFDGYCYSIAEFRDTVYSVSAIGDIGLYSNGRALRRKTDAWMGLAIVGGDLVATNFRQTVSLTSGKSFGNYNLTKYRPNRSVAMGNSLFISSDRDLLEIPKIQEASPKRMMTFGSPIIFLGVGGEEILHVGTESGAYRLFPRSGKIDTLITGFPVSSIAVDFEGGLWASTLNAGLFYLGRTASHVIGLAKPGFPHPEYLFGYAESRKSWFSLGRNGDITFFEGERTRSITNPPTSLPSGKIHAYVWLSDDSLYISGERQGSLIDLSQEKFIANDIYRRCKTLNFWVGDSIFSSTGDVLYLECKAEFIRTLTSKYPNTCLERQRANCSARQGNRLYFGSNDGVYAYENGAITPLFPEYELMHDRVNALAVDADGTVWAALANRGIAHLRRNMPVYEGDIFRLVNVSKIRTGPDGTLWACNREGVFKFFKKPDGRYGRESFTPSTGYPLANTWDVLPMDSKTYAATDQGLICFESTRNETAARLIIEELQYGTQNLNPNEGGVMQFGYPGSRFKMRYSGISFRNSGQLVYQYRISEIDTVWQRTENREIEYFDMRGGTYTLEINAVGPDGLASLTHVLRFEIKPFFWQTVWFRLICVAVVLGLASAWFRWRLGNVRMAHLQEQEKSIKEIERMEAELYLRELEQKAMRLQMNPHFIFNALNTIQGLYATKDIPRAKAYISKLSHLIRQILEQSKASTISLEMELEILRNYLDVTLYRFADLFEYQITVAADVNVDKLAVPPLILQPIVENSVIHGIAPRGRDGKIDITVTREQGDILVCIRDNGVGMNNSSALKSAMYSEERSMGMRLTKERLHLQREDETVAFWAMELVNADGTVAGTEVKIKFKDKNATA